MIQRTIMGLDFEIVSPSVMYLADQPASLAFDGRHWRLGFIGRDLIRREAVYDKRDDAIVVLKEAFRKAS